MEVKQQSIYLFPKSTFLAARSFQSSDHVLLVKRRTCVWRCVVCSRSMALNVNPCASRPLPWLSAAVLALLWVACCSDCLTQGQDFEVIKATFGLLVYGIVISACLSTRTRGIQQPGNLLFCSLFYQTKSCLNQKQILK